MSGSVVNYIALRVTELERIITWGTMLAGPDTYQELDAKGWEPKAALDVMRFWNIASNLTIDDRWSDRCANLIGRWAKDRKTAKDVGCMLWNWEHLWDEYSDDYEFFIEGRLRNIVMDAYADWLDAFEFIRLAQKLTRIEFKESWMPQLGRNEELL